VRTMQAWVAVTFAKAEQEWLEAPAALADVVLRSCSLWFSLSRLSCSGSGRDQPKKEAKIKVRGSL